eukprot:gene1120-1279_t
MSLHSFWYCMEKWSLDPQHAMKPVKRFDMISRTSYNLVDGVEVMLDYVAEAKDRAENPKKHNNNNNKDEAHAHCEHEANNASPDYEDDRIKSIVYKRHLKPRSTDRDNPMDETIVHAKLENSCTYKPVFPNGPTLDYLPFFYPKVVQYRFRYIADPTPSVTTAVPAVEGGEEEEPILGTIVMETVYFQVDQGDYKQRLANITAMLLEKLNKWGVGHERGYKKRVYHDRIIPKETYMDVYERLKAKYKNWAVGWEDVTSTDPQKFVFEDVAIASYIISLFTMENKERGTPDYKQSFVDLGCGNGLLVNILNNEGYPGIGVDLRSRKVWAKYPAEVQANLIVDAVMPKDISYPDHDWLIGNHSDELTPWVPYIASKSKTQRFFLLPCCFFNFMVKFNSNDVRIGQYATYLSYIEKVSAQCGFTVTKDAMRIPSTKNVVFVSSTRSADLLEETLDAQRQALLDECKFKEFVPRPDQAKNTPKKRYRPGR